MTCDGGQNEVGSVLIPQESFRMQLWAQYRTVGTHHFFRELCQAVLFPHYNQMINCSVIFWLLWCPDFAQISCLDQLWEILLLPALGYEGGVEQR